MNLLIILSSHDLSLISNILDAKHEKIVENNFDFFSIYIWKILPTVASEFRI